MHRLRSLRPGAFGSRRLWLAAGLPVAGLAALTTIVSISLTPLSVHRKSIAYSIASSELYVSSRGPTIAPALTYLFAPWAAVLAEEMTSPDVKGLIARTARIPDRELAIDGPVSANLQRTQQEPTGEKRSFQLLAEGDPYRIELNTDADFAAVGISAQAPTPMAAFNLTRAAEKTLNDFLTNTEQAAGTPPKARLIVAHLAPTVLSGGSGGHSVTALMFVIVLVLWSGLVVLLSKLRRELVAIRDAQETGVVQISMSSARSSVGGRF